MKHDPNKAWPYPVLRGQQQDYPRDDFEVDAGLKVDSQTAKVTVRAEFALAHRGMIDLINRGRASYVLVVKSPATHFRDRISSQDPRIEREFESGQLGGRVELTGFVVAADEIPDFQLEGWNDEYQSGHYALDAAAVLAIDQPWSTWLDQTEGGPLQAIVDLRSRPEMREWRWRCNLRGHRVHIEMGADLAKRFKQAHSAAKGDSRISTELMNGVYLPALIHILHSGDLNEAREDAYGYREYRWFDALNEILRKQNLPPLGSGEDRVSDAQVILREPFESFSGAWLRGS